MRKEERENAMKSLKTSMTEAAQSLHLLTKQRKEAVSEAKEREKRLNHCLTKDVGEQRDCERKKRLLLYGQQENQRQQITSTLMLELMQIIEEDDVPRYIHGIAKILDNYQGM